MKKHAAKKRAVKKHVVKKRTAKKPGAKKPGSKKPSVKKPVVDQPVVVCNDGSISRNASSITFVNYGQVPCTITSCGVPGWPSPPKPNPVVPAEQNGVPGTVTVQLDSQTQPGTYPYTSDCCGQRQMPPKIVVS